MGFSKQTRGRKTGLPLPQLNSMPSRDLAQPESLPQTAPLAKKEKVYLAFEGLYESQNQ